MSVTMITEYAVREALRSVRFAKSLAGSPLLALDTLKLRLREQGSSDTPQAREWELSQLLNYTSVAALSRARGTAGSPAESDTVDGPLARLQEDFRQGSPDLEAWSILYFRYFVPTRLQMVEVADKLGLVYRTLARRLTHGHTLLAAALRNIEQAATADVEPSVPVVMAEPRRDMAGLPKSMGSFIGRQEDLDALAQSLRAGRLVTLTGPGGIGKTRLALELGHAMAPEFADGAALIELAALVDPSVVPQIVAEAVGLNDDQGSPVPGAISQHLAPREILLLLDNCEQVIGAVAELASLLLEECPHLRILATSREPLHLAGEQVWPVLPLPVPVEGEGASAMGQSPAVQLFIARAQQASPDFAWSEAQGVAIGRICRCLDGIPLAIELAAARTPVLSVEDISRLLGDRFRLLTRGSRSALPRHQTMRAAVDWGYNLLGDAEQTLLRRLAVFRGWGFPAVSEVVTDGTVENFDILDVMTDLVDKSFVMATWHGSERRFRMLETLREFAWEHLVASDEAPLLLRRHLDWCIRLAEQAEANIKGADQAVWRHRIELERDNMRAALTWTLSNNGLVEPGLRLAGALGPFWVTQGSYITEGREHLRRIVSVSAGTAADPALLAKALVSAGMLARQQADYPDAVEYLEQALALYQQNKDVNGEAATLRNLGNVADEQGEYLRAKDLYLASLARYGLLGDRWGEAAVLNNLGISAFHNGDIDLARPLLEESLLAFREVDESWAIGVTLFNLANIDMDLGQLDGAEQSYTESLAISRSLNDSIGTAGALGGLAQIQLRRGNTEAARQLQMDALALIREVGDKQDIAEWLESIADLDLADGHFRRTVWLYAAATALREAIGAPVSPRATADRQESLDRARQKLGDAEFASSWATGQSWTWQQAADCAVSDFMTQER